MIETNPDYWDCDCPMHFIHRKTDPSCPLCGAVLDCDDEPPDARVNEIGTPKYMYADSPAPGTYTRDYALDKFQNKELASAIRTGSVRLALTAQSHSNKEHPELVETLAAEYDKSLLYYSRGLRNGSIMPITAANANIAYGNNGELFFST